MSLFVLQLSAGASPIKFLLSRHEQNPYVRTPLLNKMTSAVSFQLQIFVALSASSFCLTWGFRRCEDYHEQSKIKLEYFDFVYLHFHWVFFTLFAYIKFITINRRSEFFPLTILETRLSVSFNWLWRFRILITVVFLHRALRELCS